MKRKPQVTSGDFPLTKLPSTFPTQIDEKLSLGLDVGIGSCGQALVYDSIKAKANCQLRGLPDFPGRIAFLGVRAFETPQINTTTGLKLKNPERRQKRLMRRTIRRRAWRMWQIRELLKEYKILPSDYPTDKKLWKKTAKGENPTLDRWRVWHAQIDRRLGNWPKMSERI